ncbi:MAG: hypothetical protein IT181_01750 [Acidobacteria bacterium]|nr:hypothetical protein [Acidobacteriota bacterium]
MLPARLALLLLCLVALPAATFAQADLPARPDLYKFVTIQAAPGKLPELLAAYRDRAPVMARNGDEPPIVVRHSQGDRWDLLVIYPIGSFTEFYSRERMATRDAAGRASGVTNAEFQTRLYQFIAWHEDVFVWGPPLAELRAYVQGMTVAHLEMMQAMAGRHEALTRQRYMESAFNVNRGRPRMLVFTHQEGAAWDVITLDAWRDWRHYGEAQMVAPEVSEAAAKKAGFASADAVGVAMRSAINTHHDTLGTFISLAPK